VTHIRLLTIILELSCPFKI